MNYWLIFLTGLTTGGLSCLALQGGLLASTLVEEQTKTQRMHAIALFLGAKILAYTLLGFVLGILGQVFSLSPQVLGYLNIFIALFMLGVAMETLKVHPIFKFFLLQPPKFLRKLVFAKADQKGSFAATILGLFTVLIPCGITQAMMAFAVSAGRPIQGALILFFFILGTVPVFFILAYLATSIGEKIKDYFYKVVAVFLIILSIYTFINGLKLMGVNLNAKRNIPTQNSIVDNNAESQKVTIKLNDQTGYSPANITLKKDIPTEITIEPNGAQGCVRSFVIPSLKIRQLVPANKPVTIKFTPTKTGIINFTCSMGMYQGEFIVE